jgi:hypothetical protein
MLQQQERKEKNNTIIKSIDTIGRTNAVRTAGHATATRRKNNTMNQIHIINRTNEVRPSGLATATGPSSMINSTTIKATPTITHSTNPNNSITQAQDMKQPTNSSNYNDIRSRPYGKPATHQTNMTSPKQPAHITI